jgi:acyl-CoA thioesterase I
VDTTNYRESSLCAGDRIAYRMHLFISRRSTLPVLAAVLLLRATTTPAAAVLPVASPVHATARHPTEEWRPVESPPDVAAPPLPTSVTIGGNCTLVQGHDCLGHDLSNHQSKSPADCCNDCASRPGCSAFSWYSGPKLNGTPTCFLKAGCARLRPWADTVAGPHVPPGPPPPSPPSRPIRVLPLGDSITFGCGDSLSPACIAEGRGSACNLSQSPCATCAFGYRVRLFETLNTTSQPGTWQFVGTQRTGPSDCGTGGACQHEGHPGWRTTDLSSIVNSTLGPLQPDLILLHIGTNDIGRNNYATAAEAAAATSTNLRALIQQLFIVIPSAHIFLASILAMPASCHFYNHGHTANLTLQEEAYNAEVPKVAAHFGEAKVTFVDMKSETGLCDMKRSASGCCPPQLHPDGEGYGRMAAVWAKALLAWEPNVALS